MNKQSLTNNWNQQYKIEDTTCDPPQRCKINWLEHIEGSKGFFLAGVSYLDEPYYPGGNVLILVLRDKKFKIVKRYGED